MNLKMTDYDIYKYNLTFTFIFIEFILNTVG